MRKKIGRKCGWTPVKIAPDDEIRRLEAAFRAARRKDQISRRTRASETAQIER
jgi:hypothetical protein